MFSWLKTEIPVVLGHNSLEWEQWKSFPALEDLSLLHPFTPVFQSSIFEAVGIKKLLQAFVSLEIPLGLETVVLARDPSASESAMASVLTFSCNCGARF